MDLKGSQQNKNNCVTPSCHKSTICGYENDEDMKIRNKKSAIIWSLILVSVSQFWPLWMDSST